MKERSGFGDGDVNSSDEALHGLGMGIYRNLPIVAQLDLALPGRRGPRTARSSVTQARDRLGHEPIRWLGELSYAKELWPLIPDGSLAIVDRTFLAANVLIPIAAHGHCRHWLTRAKAQTTWKVLKRLGSTPIPDCRSAGTWARYALAMSERDVLPLDIGGHLERRNHAVIARQAGPRFPILPGGIT